jgi:hypothetical protein
MSVSPIEHIAKRQREYPPLNLPSGYANRLYEQLKGRLTGKIIQAFQSGRLAIGEIGIAEPNALSVALPGNRFAIEIYSGLSMFFYKVSRALCTRVEINVPGKPPVPPSQTSEQAEAIIAEVFLWFAKSGQILGRDYSIARDQMILASNLATNAELFTLAHEIGHTGIDQKLVRRISVQEEEFVADAIAMYIMLGLGQGQPVPSGPNRMAYAGVEFGLQVLSGLEKLGFSFSGSHPPAIKRLQFVRAYAKQACRTESTFNSLRTVAGAFDVLLDNSIHKISASGSPKPPSVEKSLLNLYALIEEWSKGTITESDVKKVFVASIQNTPSSDLQPLADGAAGHFIGEMQFEKGELGPRFAALFEQLVKNLSHPSQPIFASAIKKNKASIWSASFWKRKLWGQ